MTETNGLLEFTVALLDGEFENPPWGRFLDLLRLATGADIAVLNLKPPGWRHDEGLQVIAGDATVEDSRDVYRQYFRRNDPVRRDLIIQGRPYSLEEIRRLDAGDHGAFYTELTEIRGITDLREMRVEEPTGVSAWLTVARRGTQLKTTVDALLKSIAPILRGVVRNYVDRERERHAIALAERAMGGLQIGWFSIDRNGVIVDCDRFGDHVLTKSQMLSRSSKKRLVIANKAIEREVHQAIAKIAAAPDSKPRAISLRTDPWLDMLLVPARARYVSVSGAPSVICYIHGDNWRSADRYGQLRDLFSFKPKEAQLALALCRGRKIAEAAADVGITVETARSYSKILYEKTGARGIADLVRIIMGSVLALAPYPDSGPRPAPRFMERDSP